MRTMRACLVGMLVMVLSACSFSVYDLPLPGGTDTGDDPITVKVTFPDVLDLVPQSTVKVNDVSVGKVKSIELVDNQAEVTVELHEDVDLPANALASIRQTSLLGEKFVSLSAPADPVAERLSDGDRIGVERTNRNPEVEEVLGALSLVLNGGGIAQLKTISAELNKVLEGREGAAKSVLTQLRDFMGELDDNKDNIVTAIEKLNALAVSANEQTATIDLALDELPSALDSIDSQREDLVKMLEALTELSRTGTRVIKASKDVTIDALTQLQPVLKGLADSGDSFSEAFHVFLTYPFVDEAVGRDPQVARNLHMGDFVNLAVKLDLRLLNTDGEGSLPPLLPGGLEPGDVVADVGGCLGSANLGSAACKRVLDKPAQLIQLLSLCAQDENHGKLVCGILSPILNPSAGGGLLNLGRGAGGDQASPSTSGQDAGKGSKGSAKGAAKDDAGSTGQQPPKGLLGGLLGALGLGRAGQPELEVTLGDLGKTYDPTLVGLLLRGVAQ